VAPPCLASSLDESRSRWSARTGRAEPGGVLIDDTGSSLPCGWRRRSSRRRARVRELQRLERIDQAGAKIVVAFAWRKPPGAQGEDAANVGGC
jgi:hypothetical protein